MILIRLLSLDTECIAFAVLVVYDNKQIQIMKSQGKNRRWGKKKKHYKKMV